MTEDQALNILKSGSPAKGYATTQNNLRINVHPRHIKLAQDSSGKVDLKKAVYIEIYGCYPGIRITLRSIKINANTKN